MLGTRNKMMSAQALASAEAGLRPLADLGYGSTDLVWMPDAPTSKLAYRGAPQTIEVMIKAALEDQRHFETRRVAEAVCEHLDSKDYLSEYIALYNFICQRTRYMRDPRRTELVRAPYVVSQQLLEGRRPSLDCDDMATWLAAAVLAVGGTAWFATVAFERVSFRGVAQYSHVFTCALEPRSRTRIVLDPVAAETTKSMLARVQAARLWGPIN